MPDASRQDQAGELNQFLMSIEVRALQMARAAIPDRDEALDLVQESMFTLARKYAGKPSAEWRPLFFRILSNRIRDWHRRQKIRRRFSQWRGGDTPLDDPIEALPEREAASPPEQKRLQDAVARLTAQLAALPNRQREAFTLRIWEGLSVRDTAIAMNCSEGSVKTHLSRAMSALREQLEEFRS